MKFGLPDEFLEAVKMFGQINTNIEQIDLFGSRAIGNYRSGSDVDLVLKGKNLGIDEVIRFERTLEELETLNKFDILIFEKITTPSLKRVIQLTGIPLYIKIEESIVAK